MAPLTRWALLLLATTALTLPALAQVDWRTRLTDEDRARTNPVTSQPAAIAAGHQLYTQNCARCHGDDGSGVKGRPGIRTARTAGETDGEYYWILNHGQRWRGMPAWANLGDDKLWQLVAYLRSWQPAASH